MGMSHEINGNNCFVTANGLQMSSLSTCGETLVLSPNAVQNMPQLMNGLELNAFNTTFNGLDLNNSLLINTNDLTTDSAAQQILLVSSPMDLMTVTQQPLIAKQSPQTGVQMVLQTTDLPLITSGTQLNVIQVPTNLLLTDNNLIVIPQEGITLEVPALEANVSQQTLVENQLTYDNKSQTLVYHGSPQLIGQQINCYNSQNVDQLVVNLNDCIAINAINKSNESPDGNQYFQNSHQIIGIIDGNETEVIVSDMSAGFDDLNAFLASSLSATQTPECDPNEAKSWLNDSLIAYRAMAAFKKVMPNDTPSPTSGIHIPVHK